MAHIHFITNSTALKSRVFYYSGIFVLTLLLSLPAQSTWGANNANNKDPEQTRKELKSLNKKIAKLQKSQNKNINKRNKTQKKLKETEIEIGKISKKASKTEQQLIKSKSEINAQNVRYSQLSESKKQQQGALIADLRANYTAGRQEYLKLILNQKDPQTLARHVRYYEYFQKARIGRIDEFNQTMSELLEITQRLEKEAQRLETLTAQLKKQKSALKEAQAQRSLSLSKLSTTISSQKQKIKEWQTSQKHLEKILDTLINTLSDLPANIGEIPFNKRKGKMYWPTNGQVSNKFGSRRAQGRLKWNGVLIKAPSGHAVRAIHGGRVVFSDWIRSYGLLIIIDHGNGYLSLYGHNQSIYKEAGDWITAGEKIASVGNSGGSQSPGLYFEIRTGEKPINPKHWCISRR